MRRLRPRRSFDFLRRLLRCCFSLQPPFFEAVAARRSDSCCFLITISRTWIPSSKRTKNTFIFITNCSPRKSGEDDKDLYYVAFNKKKKVVPRQNWQKRSLLSIDDRALLPMIVSKIGVIYEKFRALDSSAQDG